MVYSKIWMKSVEIRAYIKNRSKLGYINKSVFYEIVNKYGDNALSYRSKEVSWWERASIHAITYDISFSKKRAKIRNRYNQAAHLTQNTNGIVTTSQLDITNKS